MHLIFATLLFLSVDYNFVITFYEVFKRYATDVFLIKVQIKMVKEIRRSLSLHYKPNENNNSFTKSFAHKYRFRFLIKNDFSYNLLCCILYD